MSQSTSRPPGRLQGRVAFITGSSGRLGRAISILLADEGARVFLVDKYGTPRNPINLSTGKADDWETRIDTQSQKDMSPEDRAKYQPTQDYICQQHGNDAAHFHSADLTDETQVANAIKACPEHHGGQIDILVNAHGISVESTHPRPLPIHETTLSDYNKTISVNTTSVFLTMKHFLDHYMTRRQSGSQDSHTGGVNIVNIASVQSLTPYYGTPSYCASKGATLMLTKQVALDYAPLGVRCNAVCPGFLDSDMTRNLQADTGLLGTVAMRHPLVDGDEGGGISTSTVNPATGPGKGGLGQVEDVARMVLVLASDDSKWMTGQAVVVDGGYSIS